MMKRTKTNTTDKRKRVERDQLISASLRALRDMGVHAGYHGQAADVAGLIQLEAHGLVTLIEVRAGENPQAFLTRKGVATFKRFYPDRICYGEGVHDAS